MAVRQQPVHLIALLAVALAAAVPTGAQTTPPPFGRIVSSDESELSGGTSWGDYDNDGDLDLAVGNSGIPTTSGFLGQANRVYRNDGGGRLTPVWQDAEADPTIAMAWGDVDNDGDLDLAVGNYGAPNRIYRNDGLAAGAPLLQLAWSAPVAGFTASLAWGDYDDDGDLDLAIGNGEIRRVDGEFLPFGLPNEIYRNAGPTGTTPTFAIITLSDAAPTTSVAWANLDDDPFLELVAGNIGATRQFGPFVVRIGAPSVLYSYNGDSFVIEPWSPPYLTTFGLAWGDLDNDGDLDLAMGNAALDNNATDTVFRNDGGVLTDQPIWSSEERDSTLSVAWGDYDGDGDLDLATGNAGGGLGGDLGQPNRLYQNEGGVLATRAVWSTPQSDDTFSVSWAEVNGDQALDLFTANGGALIVGDAPGQPNRLYLNQVSTLTTGQRLPDANPATANSIAWGDLDGDRAPDLVMAFYDRPPLLAFNRGGRLERDGSWNPPFSRTFELALGDYDGDGDLDLALGNLREPSRLYRNEGGRLTLDAGWTPAAAATTSLAWGDLDGDDDLDLVLGNFQEPSQLYRNEGGALTLDGQWAPAAAATTSVAWGDYDADGDLDLAMGNTGEPSRLYRNQAGRLVLDQGWQPAAARTESVAWGDLNGDGYLDLAMGNLAERSAVFLNRAGTLPARPDWQTTDDARTLSVRWGDADGDGDLDLALGNGGLTFENQVINQPDRVYRNEAGQLTRDPAWSTGVRDYTEAVAWVDVDGDGDLELATTGNLYSNRRGPSRGLPDNPPRIVVRTPGPPAAGGGLYGAAVVLRQEVVPISFRLSDPEGQPVRLLKAFYSLDGGGAWQEATPAEGTQTRDLAAARGGSDHTFLWHAAADLIKGDAVVVRLEAYGAHAAPGPQQYAYQAAWTEPFRVEAAPWYATVVDADGRAVAGAAVYLDGAPLVVEGAQQLTDRAGRVRLAAPAGETLAGRRLTALAPITTAATRRGAHDGWAYRVYSTNLAWGDDGQPQLFTIAAPGEQRLALRRAGPLIGFNLVVSIEWAADAAYVESIRRAMERASAYLFDVTDGQMLFEQVAIYTGGKHWADADIQIATRNIVRPHAWVGGIDDPDLSRAIRVGRGWSGTSGDLNEEATAGTGRWDEPAGYRTIVHEFGHYALGLYDSYFRFDQLPNGKLGGILPASCTGPENRRAATDAVNATIMDHQYTASELAMRDVAGLWSQANCQATVQWQYNGQSDWETLVARYGDRSVPPRWQLITPAERGRVLAGPEPLAAGQAPVLPPWPVVQADPPDPAERRFRVTIVDERGDPRSNIIVALERTIDRRVISQGFTDQAGRLEILGGRSGDLVRAATLDGGLAGTAVIGPERELRLVLLSVRPGVQVAATAEQPAVRLFAEPGQGDGAVDLTLTLTGFDAALPPDLLLSEPGAERAFSVALTRDAASGAYEGRVALAQTRGTGQVRVIGTSEGATVRLFSTYRVQDARPGEPEDLFADDGNLQIHVPPGGLGGAPIAVVVRSTGLLPGPPPAGAELVGDVYDLTASGALAVLSEPVLLRLSYDALVAPGDEALQLYGWDPNSGQWVLVPSARDLEQQTLAAPIQTMGLYALFRVEQTTEWRIWLPAIGR